MSFVCLSPSPVPTPQTVPFAGFGGGGGGGGGAGALTPGLLTGLWAAWPLDALTNVSGQSASANGLNPTAHELFSTGNPFGTDGLSIVAGKNNGALLFSKPGAARYNFGLNTNDDDSINITKDFSFSMWVKVADSGIQQPLIYISNEDEQLDIMKFSYFPPGVVGGNPTGVFNFYLSANGEFDGMNFGANVDHATMIAGFHHVVVTKTGATIKIYISGALAAQATNTIDVGDDGNTAGEIWIGADQFIQDDPDSPLVHFDGGTMDEVYVWTRALAADEVTALWNSGNGLFYVPLVIAANSGTEFQLTTNYDPIFVPDDDLFQAQFSSDGTTWETVSTDSGADFSNATPCDFGANIGDFGRGYYRVVWTSAQFGTLTTPEIFSEGN